MIDHDHETLLRYLNGVLPQEEKSLVEKHLQDCRECTGFLDFVRGFNATLSKLAARELKPDNLCPPEDMLVEFADGTLDEGIAEAIRQHTIFCQDCLEDLYLLRQAAESSGIRIDINPEGEPKRKGVTTEHELVDMVEKALPPEGSLQEDRRELAKRYAKLIISEIRLYHQSKVDQGQKNRDLYSRLKSDIEQARQIYRRQFGDTLGAGVDYFHVELVRSLANGDPALLGPDYPGPLI